MAKKNTVRTGDAGKHALVESRVGIERMMAAIVPVENSMLCLTSNTSARERKTETIKNLLFNGRKEIYRLVEEVKLQDEKISQLEEMISALEGMSSIISDAPPEMEEGEVIKGGVCKD